MNAPTAEGAGQAAATARMLPAVRLAAAATAAVAAMAAVAANQRGKALETGAAADPSCGTLQYMRTMHGYMLANASPPPANSRLHAALLTRLTDCLRTVLRSVFEECF